jgi:ankyrin repeat protein
MKKLLAAMFVALLMVGCGENTKKPGGDSSQSNQSWADTYPAKTAEAAKALLNAVKKGNIEAAKQAITDGADVNGKDRLLSCQLTGTPLHQAVNLDRQEIIELLISKGADVNAKEILFEFTSLDWAVKLKRTEITNLLRKHGGKSSAEDSIHIAARLGNIEAVKKHLDAGVDVNSKAGLHQTPLDFTKELGADDYILSDLNLPEDTLEIKAAKKEIADLLHKHGGKHSSIQEAAIGGDLEGVGAFLTAGVDPNETTGFTFGKTPLHDASTKEIAELLIAKGADVNAVCPLVGTPLHFAAMKGRKEIAELLITKGADVNFHKQGAAVTPLDRAKMKKHIETAELLRKHGGKTRRELKAEGK